MIFRLSQKLAKKVKTVPTQTLPPDANPYADWSGHLFTADRSQYIILTNTASLYSTIMHGRGIACDNDLLKQASSRIWEFMTDDGLEFAYQRFIAPTTGRIYFSKPLNRSVISSMNELVFHAKMWLTEGELSPHDTSFKLNEIPMSPLGYSNPRETFKSLTPDLITSGLATDDDESVIN